MSDPEITLRTTVTVSCSQHGDFAQINQPGPYEPEGSEEYTKYIKDTSEAVDNHMKEFHSPAKLVYPKENNV